MEQRGTSNAVHGHVDGSVVQARDIHGDVHLHHHAAPRAEPVSRPSSGLGPEVEVGAVRYLVHEHPADARSTGDGGAVVRQARCLRSGSGGLGWLRRVELREATPLARRAWRGLVAEHDLLRRLSAPGLPAVLQFAEGADDVTLVTAWPHTRAHRPCEPLDALLPGGPVRDPGVTARVCAALAGLCATLAALHAHRVAHGALTPARLVLRPDGTLLLRDLGRTDTGPPEYPAPEQLAGHAPGPRTDVHQVGAVAYHLLTGRQPDPRAPLPVRSWAPDVPAALADAVDAALNPEPARRPDVAALGARLHDLARPTR
ncbi:hypothetical protein [Actinosynnema sp. NPDC020468]|uniref:hypothetical protein n=1 Tax=Actinosynnema sp. NPDC020468 TaxID=3154488 RepID=UPI003406D2CF